MPDGETVRRVLELLRWTALALVPWVDWRMSYGSWLSLNYIPLLLFSSAEFAATTYLLLPIYLLYLRPSCQGFKPFAAYGPVYITAQEFITAEVFVLAALFWRYGRLWAPLEPGALRTRIYARWSGWLRPMLAAWLGVLAASLLLRDAPHVFAAAWAVLFWQMRRRVPPQTAETTSWAGKAATACLAVCSIVFALAIAEIGVRFKPEAYYEDDCFMPHSKYLYTLRPGTHGLRTVNTDVDEQRVIELRVSPEGFRDKAHGPKGPNEFRILVLGDSFTMGYAVEAEEAYPQCLEVLLRDAPSPLRFTTINAGVAGYGPWQERGLLNERGFALEPDLVILQLFPGNDIENSLEPVGKRFEAFNTEWHETLLRHIHNQAWPMRVHNWLHHHSRLYRAVGKAPWGGDFVDLYRSVWLLPELDLPELPPNGSRPFWIEAELADWYDAIEEGAARMRADVAGIKADCAGRGVDLAGFSMPDLPTASAYHWERALEAAPGVAYERAKSVRFGERVLEDLGIPVIPVADALIDHPNVLQYFYPVDGHLTPDGNEFVARVLRDYVLERYAPAHGLAQGEDNHDG